MTGKDEMLYFETERLMRLCCPYGSLDVSEAVRFGIEFGYDADKIMELAEQYSRATGLAMEELDIVYIVYEHVLQEARNKIYQATGYDFINDSPGGEIYTYGNCMATTYDYTEEARERLIAELAGLTLAEREELLDEALILFLEYIGIMQEDIEREAESLLEDLTENLAK